MGNFDELTPEEREKMKKLRDRGFHSLRKLCLIQLGLATISIIVGIVLVAIAAEDPKFPYIIAAPVWSGILVAIGAACGFLATKHGLNKDDVAGNVKCYVIVHYVFNVLCITVCFGCAVIAVLGVIFCQSTDPKVTENCASNKTALMALSVVSVVVGILLGIFCILGTCYFCCYGRTLGFKSKREYRMERRLQHMQRQLNDMKAAQGQGVAPPAYAESMDQGQGHFNYGYSAPGKVTMFDLSKR